MFQIGKKSTRRFEVEQLEDRNLPGWSFGAPWPAIENVFDYCQCNWSAVGGDHMQGVTQSRVYYNHNDGDDNSADFYLKDSTGATVYHGLLMSGAGSTAFTGNVSFVATYVVLSAKNHFVPFADIGSAATFTPLDAISVGALELMDYAGVTTNPLYIHLNNNGSYGVYSQIEWVNGSGTAADLCFQIYDPGSQTYDKYNYLGNTYVSTTGGTSSGFSSFHIDQVFNYTYSDGNGHQEMCVQWYYSGTSYTQNFYAIAT